MKNIANMLRDLIQHYSKAFNSVIFIVYQIKRALLKKRTWIYHISLYRVNTVYSKYIYFRYCMRWVADSPFCFSCIFHGPVLGYVSQILWQSLIFYRSSLLLHLFDIVTSWFGPPEYKTEFQFRTGMDFSVCSTGQKILGYEDFPSKIRRKIFYQSLSLTCLLGWINFDFFDNFKLPHVACAQGGCKNHL